MADSLENPQFIQRERFKRRLQQMEFSERGDLRQVVAHLLVEPTRGDRLPHGGYELAFGHYVLKYSLLDEDDPSTKIILDDIRPL